MKKESILNTECFYIEPFLASNPFKIDQYMVHPVVLRRLMGPTCMFIFVFTHFDHAAVVSWPKLTICLVQAGCTMYIAHEGKKHTPFRIEWMWPDDS